MTWTNLLKSALEALVRVTVGGAPKLEGSKETAADAQRDAERVLEDLAEDEKTADVAYQRTLETARRAKEAGDDRG